jgi:hypothetical protein
MYVVADPAVALHRIEVAGESADVAFTGGLCRSRNPEGS